MNQPTLKELTFRGMLLGALITVIFTASNVYLGLKVGLTFASSIPAAVISMAVLKFFKGSNILENNMVQTQASSAGTQSSVIFVLPAMLMVGYWQGFPFWQTLLVCMAGGILGVIFTVPLRHVMVVKSDLPYPEGVAAAEILKAGHDESHKVSKKSLPAEYWRLSWDFAPTDYALSPTAPAYGSKAAMPFFRYRWGSLSLCSAPVIWSAWWAVSPF